jgi:chromosome segregation ATPase
MDSTVAASAAEKRFAELDKDLSGARAQIADLEASRTNLVDRSAALAKASKIKEGVLHKAEQKIDYLETRMGELTKSFNAQRGQLESKAAQLSEQLEAEGAARAFAVGALQSARRDRLSLQSELIALKEGAFGANDETLSAHAEAQLAESIGGTAETAVRLIG